MYLLYLNRSLILTKITTNSINSVLSEDFKLGKNTKRIFNRNPKIKFSNIVIPHEHMIAFVPISAYIIETTV